MSVTISSNGTSGPRGSGWLSGSGAPSNAVGFDGDFYANTANYPASIVVYGPKAAGVWPASGMTMSNGSTGAASGDLSGTYPAPTVAKVNGVAVTGTPATGRVIAATSSTAATWQDPASVAPNGSASGDLSGSYPGPTVAKVNGVAVTGAPATGYVPRATGTSAATWQALPTATTGAAGLIQIDGTATDIQPVAATAVSGATGKAADAGHVHASGNWVAADNGLTWATYNPVLAGTTATLASANFAIAGRITLQRLVLRSPATLSNILYGISAIDAGAAFTNCYLGLYDSNGTLQATTADLSSAFMSATVQTKAFTGSYAAPAGEYFIALLMNGTWTGSFNFKASGGGITTNANLTAPHLNIGFITSSTWTALPASITLSTMNATLASQGWGSQWYGLS